MNDKFTNTQPEDDIARKLTQIAEQTQASGPFAAELEERLRSAHRPRAGWWLTFSQISPTLRWAALMVLLAIVLSWSIRTLIPAPQPAVQTTPSIPESSTPTTADEDQNPTPAPEGEGVEFRGAQLFMNVDLPASPGQANVYQVIPPEPATIEYAQALAQQFGVVGEVYLAPGPIPNTTAYMVTDGKQQLIVYGEENYTYTSDMVANGRTYNGAQHENAETIIHEFLQSHGFNANVKLIDGGTFAGYVLRQISPDGLPIEYQNYAPSPVRVTLTEAGEVLSMTVVMVNYDPNALGSYGIISADEALQLLLDDTISAGKLEIVQGGPRENFVPPQIWYHEYPDEQTVTVYGNVSSSPALDSTKPAVVFIDSVQAVGNIGGMDALDYYTFVQATGQFIVEDGVRRFNVESWSTNVENVSIFGGLRREGDQVIVNDQNGGANTEYILVDPPADLPAEVSFPESQVTINGAVVDGKLYWSIIDYFADTSNMGGGGGGGGGQGFYQLNLSGTPIPFPSAAAVTPGTDYTPAELASFIRHTVKDGDTLASIASTYNVSVSELNRVNNLSDENMIAVGWVLIIPGVAGPTHLEGEEGTMHVQIFEKPDGRLREAYTFISKQDQTYYEVKGENLGQLQEAANRPIRIWGSISYDEMGLPFLTFERYESLYPELQFEVLKGTQQNTQIDGMDVILFTTGGTTYIQVNSSGGYPDYSSYDGVAEVNLEVLRVPGETLAGYPALRVFNSGPAVNNATGEELLLPRVTQDLVVIPDPYGNADTYVFPDVIIDHVELIYLTNHPSYPVSEDPNAPPDQGYMQPVWHFEGHYSNGDFLEITIQALQQQYLSPDLGPQDTPG